VSGVLRARERYVALFRGTKTWGGDEGWESNVRSVGISVLVEIVSARSVHTARTLYVLVIMVVLEDISTFLTTI
jgi:hypothetical protein